MADYAPPDRPALDEWLAQAPPPPPPPRSMSSSLSEGLTPYVQDASEAAASRVRAPYARAEARESSLPSLLGHYGEKIKSALTASQRALTGELQVNDPETNMPTREAIGEAGSLAGILAGGGMPMAEKGALGMFGGRPTYSAAAEAVRTAKLQTGTPDQWLGYLKNYQGVKPSELEEVGLEPWLKNRYGKVTRDEVNQYIESKQPQLREILKQHDDDPLVNQLRGERGQSTKYSSYQLPGGSNYGETLLTLPTKPKPREEFARDYYNNFIKKGGDTTWEELPEWNRENFIKNAPHGMNTGENVYQSSHWDEPNVLLHVRHNDRTVPGPNGEPMNSLHLEELQSDWHQAGRKDGYKQDIDPSKKQTLTAERDRLAEEVVDKNLDVGHPNWTRINQINSQLGEWTGQVPDAPFKQTWPDLGLKRMLHRAATETNPDGTPKYHALSWTPGEAQAARYDLSKQVSKVRYNRGGGDTPDTHSHYPSGTLQVFGKNGELISNKRINSEGELADNIGKEAAEKLINTPSHTNTDKNGKWHTLEGLDLKVGGEGMKAFYDKMLVDKVNALTKKYGAKVDKSHVGVPHKGGVQGVDLDVPYIRITPELRAAAMKGFPTFAIGGAAALGAARNRNDK